MEGFYWKKGEARELLKQKIISGPGHLLLGGRKKQGRVFYAECLFFFPPLWGMERTYLTDYLIGVDWKIPDWTIEMLPGAIETK